MYEMFTEAQVQAFHDHIEKAQRILLLAPKNIDGDTIGTNTALYLYLTSLGKEAILYSPVPLDEKMSGMPHIDAFVHAFDPYEVDLIISSDTAVPHLFLHTDAEEILFSRKLPWINLDHHVSNSEYGTLNLLHVEATSCSILLYELFTRRQVQITPDMATHMLLSIYMDSGSFIHPNTKPFTYRIAADLTRLGGDIRFIGTTFFRTNDLSKLRLWGLVLDRMHLSPDGILMSYIFETDMLLTGTTKEDIDGLVDTMNTIPNRVCVLLTEDGQGNVKGSLRTMDDHVDVNLIAKRFGGGGHKKAAGFTLRDTKLSDFIQFQFMKHAA